MSTWIVVDLTTVW